MSLSTEQMFRHIVEMQIELNEKTVPGWLDKGLDWDTAILTEVAEAIDSTDWKWWKHTETDLANLRVEAIDLLHFLVAQIAENAWHVRRPGTGFVNAVCMRLTEAYSWAKVDDVLGRDKSPNYVMHLKGVARHTLNTEPVQALHELFLLFASLGMDDKSIYQDYITKNLLNHYRQERGYNLAAHGYKKIINGREDNVIFAEVVGLALAFYNKVSSVDGFDIKTLGQDETEGLGKAILANTSFKIHLKSDSPSIEKIKELAFNLMDDAVNGGLSVGVDKMNDFDWSDVVTFEAEVKLDCEEGTREVICALGVYDEDKHGEDDHIFYWFDESLEVMEALKNASPAQPYDAGSDFVVYEARLPRQGV